VIQTFKGALHDVVFNSKVPAKQLADNIGKGYTYLANAANESQEDSHLRGRDIITLTNATNNFALLDYLEHACGRVAFRIPELGKIGASSFNEAVITTIEHLGELSRKYREFMSDNILSVDERRELEALKFEIMRHVMSLLEDITK
jgi:hypothetical protein